MNEALTSQVTLLLSQPSSTVPRSFLTILLDYISSSKDTTYQGFSRNLREFTKLLIENIKNKKNVDVLFLKSLSDIFFEFLIKNYPQGVDFEEVKCKLTSVGKEFVDSLENATEGICGFARKIIKNSVNFIVLGHSDLLQHVLIKTAAKSVRFSVIIPEQRPSCHGYELCNTLAANNIKTSLIVDSALAIYLDQADFVLTSADAVVENGGIINQLGTYSLALLASAKKKPFYVLSETYRFSRIFPLSQGDLKNIENRIFEEQNKDKKENTNLNKEEKKNENFDLFNNFILDDKVMMIGPEKDYTPPELITLLVTEKGIFTPSAVTDELLQIFGK